MTQMSETAIQQAIPAGHFTGLKAGEVRTFAHTTTTGQTITVKLYAVVNGGFTRLDVRGDSGKLMPECSGTCQFESDALRDYIAVLRWLVQQ